MDQSLLQHLAQHYQLLELPVGASFDDVESRYRRLRAKAGTGKRRNINGHPAFKFLPRLDRAFNVLKQAHRNPEILQLAAVNAMQPVQNATQPSQAREDGKTGATASTTYAAPSKLQTAKPLNTVDIANSLDPSVLNKTPTYVPQTSFIPASSPTDAPGFEIQYQHGNILNSVQDRSVLVHAVNCQGVWGMGIAYQIKKDLPGAFKVYEARCSNFGIALVGTCLLVPPQPVDYEVKDRKLTLFTPRRWVACLFTSAGYGKKNSARNNPGRDSPATIIAQTKTALEDLRMQLDGFGPTNFDTNENWKTDDEKPGQILAVKFNSGAFGVPWESTEALIQIVFKGFERPWSVFDGSVPPEPKSKGNKGKSPWVISEAPDE